MVCVSEISEKCSVLSQEGWMEIKVLTRAYACTGQLSEPMEHTHFFPLVLVTFLHTEAGMDFQSMI